MNRQCQAMRGTVIHPVAITWQVVLVMLRRWRTALGHATSGPALQQNLVCVMEGRG